LVILPFKNNYKFTKHFHFLENKVGDNKRINFSFKVAKNIHPILLEAICEDEEQLDEDIYFMLKSPIYRRPDVSGDYNPLHLGRSGHREAINCLIIVSDVKGPVPEIEQTLVRLSNIAPEAEMLCGLFNEYRQQLNLQPARVISRASEGKTFGKLLKATHGIWSTTPDIPTTAARIMRVMLSFPGKKNLKSSISKPSAKGSAPARPSWFT
jgi:hypothetical protein